MFLAVLAALALGLVPATSAQGANEAAGYLAHSTADDCAYISSPEADSSDEGECLASFQFIPRGEHVKVFDETPNGWGVLVELWWGGELQRWCWNDNSFYGNFQDCNFEIKEGQNIRFYIAEFHKKQWDRCAPNESDFRGEA